MSGPLIANHILSFTVVMSCWWLAHLSSASHEPYGRLTAAAYGALGVITIVLAVFRQIELTTPWLPVAYKLCLLALFAAKIARLQSVVAVLDRRQKPPS